MVPQSRVASQKLGTVQCVPDLDDVPELHFAFVFAAFVFAAFFFSRSNFAFSFSGFAA